MSNIYCTKCGIEGYSKCPYCRSIFVDKSFKHGDYPTAQMDTWFSDIMKIEEKRVSFALYNDQTVFDRLKMLRDVLKDAPDEALKVLSCVHTWAFKDCCTSSIDCGHGSHWPSPEAFIERVETHLLETEDLEAIELIEKVRK